MVETAVFCSEVPWKKPSLVDSDPVHCSNVDDSVLAWKRPRLPSEQAAVRPGRGSWKKPKVATVPIASDGNGAGANHLVWHSISIDEPTLSLIKLEESEMTDYKRNALDPSRIAKLSAQSCGCKGSCFTLFQPNQILGVCRLWHGLPDDSQHHFLNAQWEGSWVCGDAEKADVAHRTSWFFARQRVCLAGLCGLLGTGKKSMLKKVQGVVDMRRKLNESLQANLVDMFFLELYHQSAEDLPETFQAQDVDARMSMEQGFEVGADMALYTKQIEKVEEVFSWTPEAAISQNIMALSAVSLSTVPVRHLPPGKPMALYWQFQSWCEAAANFSGDPNNVKTPS